jgi:hypothetical protein
MTTARTFRRTLALAALALTGPRPAAAQQPLAVPKFPIAPSGLGLTGDVRPHQYLGVIGRRAAWLGEETGTAELWVHPFKLADRFALSFKIPDYVEPIPGADVARTGAPDPARRPGHSPAGDHRQLPHGVPVRVARRLRRPVHVLG